MNAAFIAGFAAFVVLFVVLVVSIVRFNGKLKRRGTKPSD